MQGKHLKIVSYFATLHKICRMSKLFCNITTNRLQAKIERGNPKEVFNKKNLSEIQSQKSNNLTFFVKWLGYHGPSFFHK